MTAHTLNHRLATLLGWTNIIELGGALLGTPPAGEPQCRGQALVPDWAGDWRACGPLMAEYMLVADFDDMEAACGWGVLRLSWQSARYAERSSKDVAARESVVLAVITKLEAGQ